MQRNKRRESKVPWAVEVGDSENYSSNVTVQLFTMSVNSLKYQLSMYMSQVMSCSFTIYIDELVGLEVPIHNGDNLLWILMFY